MPWEADPERSIFAARQRDQAWNHLTRRCGCPASICEQLNRTTYAIKNFQKSNLHISIRESAASMLLAASQISIIK